MSNSSRRKIVFPFSKSRCWDNQTSDLSLVFTAPIGRRIRGSRPGFTGTLWGRISRDGGLHGPGRGHDTVFVGPSNGAAANDSAFWRDLGDFPSYRENITEFEVYDGQLTVKGFQWSSSLFRWLISCEMRSRPTPLLYTSGIDLRSTQSHTGYTNKQRFT